MMSPPKGRRDAAHDVKLELQWIRNAGSHAGVRALQPPGLWWPKFRLL